ncbi:MAG: type II secretion system major pseudopilin GspG [Halanaerobiales bacterium]
MIFIKMTEVLKDKHKREEAFTRIEILIAIVIVAAFLVVVGPELFSRISQSNQTAAGNQIDVFKVALNNYRLDNGRYPTTQQGLEALIEEPTAPPLPKDWNGPYLEKKEIPEDPWGNEYQYQVPGRHNTHKYDLWSYGKDGVEGGTDENADVTNW